MALTDDIFDLLNSVEDKFGRGSHEVECLDNILEKLNEYESRLDYLRRKQFLTFEELQNLGQ